MNQNELVRKIAKENNVKLKDTELIIEKFLEEIMFNLENGHKIVLSGFGTFEPKIRKGRKGYDPFTGQDVFVPPVPVISFKTGSKLKDKIKKTQKI